MPAGADREEFAYALNEGENKDMVEGHFFRYCNFLKTEKE